jgi:hypothetical protein
MIKVSASKILHLDIEARPLSWYGGDYVTREVTAVAWKWQGEKQVYSDWNEFNEDPHEPTYVNMLLKIRVAYEQADIVTGHYIRGYDLPTLNGAMIEQELGVLPDKWTIDTKLDMVKRSGMSNSQESLAAEFGLKTPKRHMNQAEWREANRLTQTGIKLALERVRSDVKQHEELFKYMRSHELLGRGRMWTATSSGANRGYHA